MFVKTDVISIRQAHLSDARLISVIGKTSWLEHYSKYLPKRPMAVESIDSLAAYVRVRMRKAGTIIYIAYLDNKACAVAILMRKHIGYLELDWLFVLPNYQNLRIGYHLIELCKKKAKKEYLRLTLSALRKNMPARRFYARHGGVSGRHSFFTWDHFPVPDVWYTWK